MAKQIIEIVKNIDNKLLKSQKLTLVKLASSNKLTEKEIQALDGIISMLDHIQDCITDTELDITEKEAIEVLEKEHFVDLWGLEDIKNLALNNYEVEMEDKAVREVFSTLKDKYDIKEGMNWNVVDNTVRKVLNM